MKRTILCFILALMLPACALAQRIEMEDARLAFEYPDSWLVVSPQLARVYERQLEDGGIDSEALAEEMLAQGVLSRAYREGFRQHMSVLTKTDDLSEDVFDIGRITDEQRRTLRNRVENNNFWEDTGYRAQDVEWQKERGAYWLYVHYTRTSAGETIGRGLRYITIRNGAYVMLDWQIDSGRFGNRDLSYFRGLLGGMTVTEMLAEPVRACRLEALIPAETSTAEFTIAGKTNPGATLVAEAPDAMGNMQTLSVGEAGTSGNFKLLVELEEEGAYALTLTASKDGLTDTRMEGMVTYSAKTLPLTLAGVEEGGVHTVTTNETKLTGETLAGVQMQLVTPFGLSKKRANNDGTFSFDLSTKDVGEYRYTLILDKGGFDQRRVAFTLVRVKTDDQEKADIRAGAEKISYKNLQKDLEENRGKVMNLYGPVTEVSQSGGTQYLRMQFNKRADGTWYNPVVIVTGEDTGAKQGDMLSAVVKVTGVFEEQDSSGEPVMVPSFELVFVDRLE